MKFFTPELYARLNSSDDGEFERANAEWHEALANYRRHIEELAPYMSEGARQLALNGRFHDSEVFAEGAESLPRLKWAAEPSSPGRTAELFSFSLVSEFGVTFIQYVLTRPVKRARQADLNAFASEKAFWLYDEIMPDLSTTTTAAQATSPALPIDLSHNVLHSNDDRPVAERHVYLPIDLIHNVSCSATGWKWRFHFVKC